MLLDLFWLLFQSCFSGILPLCCFFLKVLFFTALVGATLLRWMVLLSLFLRPSSLSFSCGRHIVGLLSLFIVSVLGFPWDLPFYPGPHHSSTVHSVFQYDSFIYTACFFFSRVLRFLLPTSSSELFCSFSHFAWLISSDCAFPGVGNM